MSRPLPRVLVAGRASSAAGRSRSLVAGVNALFRSRESAGPAQERLLSDPYARLFGERHPLIWALRLLRPLLPPLRRLIDDLQIAHCVRHRSIDELCLQAAARDGFRQIVLLGAGYDTRPLRLAPRLPDVRWIEVDHPATAARKARLWQRFRLDGHARRVVLDLEHDGIVPALQAAGFDSTAPACFVLEGLAHYLPRARVAHLLAAAARGPGRRRVILSYIRPDMAASAPSLFVALVHLLREVPTTHFNPGALSALAHGAGLRAATHYTFDKQVRHLLPHAPSHVPRLTQDLATFDTAAAPAE